MTESCKRCCLNPRKWYSIIIFTQISTVTWCNLYVCTNHHSFGIPAKIHVYIIMNEHSQRTSWAFQLRFLAMSHTEGSWAKILKVVKFYLFDIYDVSPDFGPTQRLLNRTFSLFQQELIQFIARPCSSTVGFRKFPKPQQLLGILVWPLLMGFQLQSFVRVAEFFLGLAIVRYWLWRYAV